MTTRRTKEYEKIIRHCHACFLNVQVEGEAPPLSGGDRRLGIDLGINNIAVRSDNTFFNSKHLKNTSQTCSKCGHVFPNNRTGRQFECIQGGFTLDSASASRMQRAMRPSSAASSRIHS